MNFIQLLELNPYHQRDAVFGVFANASIKSDAYFYGFYSASRCLCLENGYHFARCICG